MDASIKDDDLLGRAVFSSKSAKRAKSEKEKIKNMRIFLERPGISLSVDRFGFCSIENLTRIQNKNAESRPSQKFYGWVKIEAHIARRTGRTVKATPLKCNPYHADIILPKNITRDEETMHAKELASNSVGWVEKSGE